MIRTNKTKKKSVVRQFNSTHFEDVDDSHLIYTPRGYPSEVFLSCNLGKVDFPLFIQKYLYKYLYIGDQQRKMRIEKVQDAPKKNLQITLYNGNRCSSYGSSNNIL